MQTPGPESKPQPRSSETPATSYCITVFSIVFLNYSQIDQGLLKFIPAVSSLSRSPVYRSDIETNSHLHSHSLLRPIWSHQLSNWSCVFALWGEEWVAAAPGENPHKLHEERPLIPASSLQPCCSGSYFSVNDPWSDSTAHQSADILFPRSRSSTFLIHFDKCVSLG